MNPTTKSINDALQSIEAAERDPNHPRSLAREAVAEYRQETAISPTYDFNAQPKELRQIIYNQTVRFHCRRRWRLFR